MTKYTRLALCLIFLGVILPIALARFHQHHENQHKSHHGNHHHDKKSHHHQHHNEYEKNRSHLHHKKHEHEGKVTFHAFQNDVDDHPLNHIGLVEKPLELPEDNLARASRNRRNQDATQMPTSVYVTETTMSIERTTKSAMQMDCKSTSDCKNVTNSNCDDVSKTCVCDGELSVFIKTPPGCYKAATLNATCSFDDQCLHVEEFSKCDVVKKICVCIPGYEMKEYPDVGVNCVTKSGKSGGVNVDPAMIGVLAGLALMFIIICVVLRLFSKARFRENRSIFNTPNPRLMNASLFKDSKLLSPARGDRRGSKASVRGPPSRAQSITSMNKDSAGRSPNGSLAKGRRGSALSTASATGSATVGVPTSAKSPIDSPAEEKGKETTVAIEAVD